MQRSNAESATDDQDVPPLISVKFNMNGKVTGVIVLRLYMACVAFLCVVTGLIAISDGYSRNWGSGMNSLSVGIALAIFETSLFLKRDGTPKQRIFRGFYYMATSFPSFFSDYTIFSTFLLWVGSIGYIIIGLIGWNVNQKKSPELGPESV